LRGLEEWDAKDGEVVGGVLVMKGETKVEARLRELMVKQKGLKELGRKYEWFEVLLLKIVENKLRPAGDSKAKLCNMSAKQANIIGGALASCIAANLTALAAVDEWILRYPALGVLVREYVRERRERKQRASGSGAPTNDANNRASKTGWKSGRARQQATPTSARKALASAPTTSSFCAPTSDTSELAEGVGERALNLLLLRANKRRNERAEGAGERANKLPSLAFASLARRAMPSFLCALFPPPLLFSPLTPPPHPPPPGTCGSGP
jgi:hypothetical protein